MAETSLVIDDPLKLREEIIGLKFKPSDETLVSDYLGGKVSGRNSSIWQHIKEVDLYKVHPSELRSLACDLDKKMYFFVPVCRKFVNGEKNINRIAPGGHWKKTGKLSFVKDKNGKPFAKKTCLAYYKYDQNSVKKEIKTQWLMKEYMLYESLNDKNSKTMQTLCVVYLHDLKKRKACASENESYDKESDRMSLMVEPCPPPTQNSSFDCSQQNLNNHHDYSRAGKRHCPSDPHEQVSIMNYAYCFDPPFNCSSEPVSNLEGLYTPTISPQNMQNPLSGSSEAAAEYLIPVVQDYRPDFIPEPYLALESGQYPDPSIICNSYNQQLCTDLQPLHRSDDSDRWGNPSLDAVPSFNTTDVAPPFSDLPLDKILLSCDFMNSTDGWYA